MSERYQILGKLARGGIGAIYRAHDTVMGRDVAIKRLLPLEETHLNEAADGSLEREAAALAQFQHPNVVTIYAFESDDEGSYVVMELVEGENLKETIERGALPIDDFEDLVLQTLDPLIAARDMNLLHRDIKPSNIMLTWLSTGRFQVKVLDFGLAKFSHLPSTQTLDQTGSFLGSIDYLAPEQLELAPLDQRTDLYSLGCVLYFCLTQRPPFEGANSGETIQNHLKQKVTPLSELRADVPQPVSDWVMRMISRYPNQRPDDARVALKEFEAALTGVSPATFDKPSEPVVEVVEELPVARVAEEPAPHPAVQATVIPPLEPKRKSPVIPSAAERPKLNTAPPPGVAKSKRTPAAAVVAKPRTPASPGAGRKESARNSSDLKKPLIALACSIVAAGVVLILLFKPGGKDGNSGRSGESSRTTSQSQGAGSKATKGGKQNPSPKAQAPAPALPEVVNPSTPSGVPPPPVSEGLAAHFKAGERTWAGKDFQTPAEPGERIKAWGNIAAGTADDHLMTVDPAHQDKGPQLKHVGPKGRPEFNKAHSVLAFRNIDRLITRPSEAIGESLTGKEWTTFLVMRTESQGGQILRLMGETLPSRLLKIEISGRGAKIKSVMSRGSLRPFVETEFGEGKGKFLIFTHVWSGDEFGEQRHHFQLPGSRRNSGKPGDAPHMKMPQSPVSYALGATAGTTAEPVGTNADGNPQKENTGGFKGEIAEWLIYRRVLSDPERKQVEDYLFKRYFAK